MLKRFKRLLEIKEYQVKCETEKIKLLDEINNNIIGLNNNIYRLLTEMLKE